MAHSSKVKYQFVHLQVSESIGPPLSSLSFIIVSLSWAAPIFRRIKTTQVKLGKKLISFCLANADEQRDLWSVSSFDQKVVGKKNTNKNRYTTCWCFDSYHGYPFDQRNIQAEKKFVKFFFFLSNGYEWTSVYAWRETRSASLFFVLDVSQLIKMMISNEYSFSLSQELSPMLSFLIFYRAM